MLITQVITLDDWFDIARATGKTYSAAAFLFLFIVIVVFVALQMLTAVVTATHRKLLDAGGADSDVLLTAELQDAPSRLQRMASRWNLLLGRVRSRRSSDADAPVGRIRTAVRELVRSQYFEGFLVAALLLNCIVLAMDHYRIDAALNNVLNQIQNALSCVFVAEVALRWVAADSFLAAIVDVSFLFDSLVVATNFAVAIADLTDRQLFVSANYVVLFRTVRVLRILPTMRLFRRSEVISRLFGAIAKNFSKMGHVSLAVLLTFAIFASLGLQLFANVPHLFGSVGAAWMTLFWVSLPVQVTAPRPIC